MKHTPRHSRVPALGHLGAVLLSLGAIGGCQSGRDAHDDIDVLDNQRWVFEDQLVALSETRLRRTGNALDLFFSPDHSHWGEIGDQITDATGRWAGLADPWPDRNLPAQDIDKAP